jgi:putative ABC transport system permease protein
LDEVSVIPVSYNVRSLLVRKTTTIATALGIGLVVFVLALVLMLSSGITKTMANAGRADNALVLRKGSDAEMASSIEIPTMNLVAAGPGIKRDASGTTLASGEIVVVIAPQKLGAEPGQVANVLVRGVSEVAQKVHPEVHVVEGRPPQPGTDEVMIGRGIVGRFEGMQIGGSFDLKKNRPVKVVGVFEAGGTSFESEVWVGLDTARSSFGREGLVNSVAVRLESPSKFDAFKAAMENDKQLQLDALVETRYYEKASEGTSDFIFWLGIIISVFFAFGAIVGAVITMYAAVAQRQREIGTLRALGFSRMSILFSFILESLTLSIAGGLLGIGLALAVGTIKLSMINGATWSEVTFSFDPHPLWLGIALLAGAGMGVVGGLFPAIRAARVSPVQAMRA